MDALTTDQIRNAFINSSKRSAREVVIPPLDDVPWQDLDFLGWMNPRMPQRRYLATWFDEKPVSVELRMASSRASNAGRTSMCEFCQTVHSAGNVRLLSAAKAGRAGKRGDTVGNYWCVDMDCSLYARHQKRPSRVQPMSTLTAEQRVDRLKTAVNGFLRYVVASSEIPA